MSRLVPDSYYVLGAEDDFPQYTMYSSEFWSPRDDKESKLVSLFFPIGKMLFLTSLNFCLNFNLENTRTVTANNLRVYVRYINTF